MRSAIAIRFGEHNSNRRAVPHANALGCRAARSGPLRSPRHRYDGNSEFLFCPHEEARWQAVRQRRSRMPQGHTGESSLLRSSTGKRLRIWSGQSASARAGFRSRPGAVCRRACPTIRRRGCFAASAGCRSGRTALCRAAVRENRRVPRRRIARARWRRGRATFLSPRLESSCPERACLSRRKRRGGQGVPAMADGIGLAQDTHRFAFSDHSHLTRPRRLGFPAAGGLDMPFQGMAIHGMATNVAQCFALS